VTVTEVRLPLRTETESAPSTAVFAAPVLGATVTRAVEVADAEAESDVFFGSDLPDVQALTTPAPTTARTERLPSRRAVAVREVRRL
jgi:hypothetical protein